MQGDQQSTAKEQGNDREGDSGTNMTCPTGIVHKAQIGQPSNVAEAQQRPKQEHGSNQDCSVKKRVEIVFRQKRKNAMRSKRLSRPEQNWSKQCSGNDDRDKIGR